jgi:poly-gamma-glutamate capsule biosynthesis protein CapA/YwtB (metallophosphatase superfamily)
MKRRMKLYLFGVFLITGTLFVATHKIVEIPHTESAPSPIPIIPLATRDNNPRQEPVRLVFTGDVMLGRTVESIIARQGFEYLFNNVSTTLRNSDLTTVNFEGVVTSVHEQAKPMTFKFSIQEKFLMKLSELGVDVLSLANNHSYDYGKEEYQYMHVSCVKTGLVCGGSPLTVDDSSSKIIQVKGKEVGITFLHTLYNQPTQEEIKKAFDVLERSDLQIAYVHWGEEYVLEHNEAQEELAHMLIDLGFDAVIGHHPHVVQDVDMYKGKPIFYSLGNFIFDQYFSSDVQQMMLISADLGTSTVTYTVHALTSEKVRSQPQFMTEEEREQLLSRVFSPLRDNGSLDQKDHTIVVPL